METEKVVKIVDVFRPKSLEEGRSTFKQETIGLVTETTSLNFPLGDVDNNELFDKDGVQIFVRGL